VHHRRKLVDAAQSSAHARKLLLGDEICLVEQQSVRKGDLREGQGWAEGEGWG